MIYGFAWNWYSDYYNPGRHPLESWITQNAKKEVHGYWSENEMFLNYIRILNKL